VVSHEHIIYMSFYIFTVVRVQMLTFCDIRHVTLEVNIKNKKVDALVRVS